MELQENGLPLGAEFVGVLRAKAGDWVFDGITFVCATGYWHCAATIIRFPIYGKPPEQVDLKGQKLLGGSMRTAYGRAEPGQAFINADGDVMKIPSNSCTTTAPFIRLEPQPKKRRVLDCRFEITGDFITLKTQSNGSMFFFDQTFVKLNGGTIKEVEDVA